MADAMAMRFAMETEQIPGARTRTYSRASALENIRIGGKGRMVERQVVLGGAGGNW